MGSKIPYVNQPGSIIKILNKIKDAKTPERFTQDFLETKLGCRGGNYRQFIPFAKKLGLLNTDGTPTDYYKKYRNTATSEAALAEAVRNGYKELFERNEFANNLSKDQFKGLVVEITGLESKNRVVQLICQTFESLKNLANFEVRLPQEGFEGENEEGEGGREDEGVGSGTNMGSGAGGAGGKEQGLGLNLSYVINLVLPKTDDLAVFNAIFRSLRDNLLRK